LNQPAPNLRRRILLASLLALAFVCLVVTGYLWMQSAALAWLSAASGTTLRDHHDQMGKWEDAAVGAEFGDGDGAKTPLGVTAHFRLGRAGTLTLSPASQVRFRKRGQSGKAVGLTVEVGEIEVRTADGTLNLGSEFGELVIEPRSRIKVTRKGDRLLLGVNVGRLRLSRSGRSLGPGERITVAVGGIVITDPNPDPGGPAGAVGPGGEGLGEPRIGQGLSYADLVVRAGDSFVVHDEAPPTAIGFRFDHVCPEGARLEIGSQWTEARRQGALSLGVGQHDYSVRCLNQPDKVVKRGSVRIMRDSGTRQLPTFTPTAQVSADGRTYTVLYQARLPSVTVVWPTAPDASGYTLDIDGRAVQTKKPSHTFGSGVLAAGKHTVTFSAKTTPLRASRPTTILIKVDAQAPTARVADPPPGFAPGGSVPVGGQALPGWTVSVGGAEVQKDASGRFSTTTRVDGTLAIAFSHPTHGMHYYLRRPRGARGR